MSLQLQRKLPHSVHNELESYELTGLEIVPYIPRDRCIFYQDQEDQFYMEVSKFVRRVVNESLVGLQSKSKAKQRTRITSSVIKADSDGQKTTNLDMVVSKNEAQKKRIRHPTSHAGETLISFEFLNDFHFNNLDINQILKKYESQLAFSERLCDWKIVRRQRAEGRYDLYFEHPRLKKSLRSFREITNYLLYNDPYKRNKKNCGSKKEASDNRRSNITPLKRKSTSQSEGYTRSNEEITRRAVEKFLADSYKNMLKLP